jgi:hypothetical protein
MLTAGPHGATLLIWGVSSKAFLERLEADRSHHLTTRSFSVAPPKWGGGGSDYGPFPSGFEPSQSMPAGSWEARGLSEPSMAPQSSNGSASGKAATMLAGTELSIPE